MASRSAGETTCTTNLSNWQPLPGVVQDSNGIYWFSDPAMTNYPFRFYRLFWQP